MPASSSTRSNVLTLAALLFAQLLLMSGSVREAGGATLLESWSMRATSPVVAAARFVGGGLRGLGGGIANLLHAHSRNAALQVEVGRLRSELRAAREHSLENERLRRLLGMREELEGRSVAARVVSLVFDKQTKMIVIDRGLSDGVRVDHPAVAWGGAVGRVVEASASHAKVQLITDPNAGAGGVVQRSRVHGMVFGREQDRLVMRFVPLFSDVMHGDRVVTSGLDGIYPRGFGIGTVTRIHTRVDGTQQLELRPELRFATLEEVLVLTDPVGEDRFAPGPGEEPS